MTLLEYIKTGKITKQRKSYRCEICNYSSDTPFEAIKCYNSHKPGKPTKQEAFWKGLDDKERAYFRRKFNKSCHFDEFETVKDYAYFFQIRKERSF